MLWYCSLHTSLFALHIAKQAGIESRRLTIALEPEAGSIYCRHRNLNVSSQRTKGKGFSRLNPGMRYMIIDAGGGTVEITVHDVDENDKIKEVHAACGGDWGGTVVDKKFETVLLELVGETVYQRFKNENLEDYLQLWRDFEIKKRTVVPSSSRPTNMNLPLSIIVLLKEIIHKDLKNIITNTKYEKDIEFTSTKMKISANLMKSFFDDSVNNIIPFVKSILEKKHIQAILMVGGYSESPMLQEAVRSNFPNIEVVIPEETSYSIMKGALIFGFIPTIISKRVLKYTYGVRSTVTFVKGKHPESKRVLTDTGEKCTDIFSKHVERDQEVTVGQSQVCVEYKPAYKNQKSITISVYASSETNPEYTDKNCHFVGEMIVKLSADGDLDRKIEVALSFSDTEIVVSAKEMKTGNKTFAAIDFIG